MTCFISFIYFSAPVSSPVHDEAGGEDESLIEREKNRLPRGVLVFHRGSKGPKKSLKWKAESELESVHFFELDETERGKNEIYTQEFFFFFSLYSVSTGASLRAGAPVNGRVGNPNTRLVCT